MENRSALKEYDIFVIGGGINGCGIARDAAGRGLSVGLAEMNDLGSATSSASTKLFHGGLRYLEYFEIRLVRKALIERETLLRNMPHISWPMRFVLPYHRDMRFQSDTPSSRLLRWVMPWMRGRRPAWLIRLGLFLYDHLGGRKILPATSVVDLTSDPTGAPLLDKFTKAYEYSDCWVEDSRLVVLNACDAAARGADIMPRTKVVHADRKGDHWVVTLQTTDGETRQIQARFLVNAAGPWVEQVIHGVAKLNSTEGVRLVRGSHIVIPRLFDHDKCYFFQGGDGRIIFAIPYEGDFTLIGTTDAEHDQPDHAPECTAQEQAYLCDFAAQYFKRPITRDDIVWTYSGVRPLFDDGAASASAATREYVLRVDANGGAPVLNVFGGKITTYRKLAEAALDRINAHFDRDISSWTAQTPLPGGDFAVDGGPDLIQALQSQYPFLTKDWAQRLVRAYGTLAGAMLDGAKSPGELGPHFGATLYAQEVKWLIKNEFAHDSQDILWRRSKLGLRLSETQAAKLQDWIDHNK